MQICNKTKQLGQEQEVGVNDPLQCTTLFMDFPNLVWKIFQIWKLLHRSIG